MRFKSKLLCLILILPMFYAELGRSEETHRRHQLGGYISRLTPQLRVDVDTNAVRASGRANASGGAQIEYRYWFTPQWSLGLSHSEYRADFSFRLDDLFDGPLESVRSSSDVEFGRSMFELGYAHTFGNEAVLETTLGYALARMDVDHFELRTDHGQVLLADRRYRSNGATARVEFTLPPIRDRLRFRFGLRRDPLGRVNNPLSIEGAVRTTVGAEVSLNTALSLDFQYEFDSDGFDDLRAGLRWRF